MAYASGRGVPPAEIIGHRGSPRDFRENTLRSFARAFQDGADGIELDVHGTRDGAVVVHHDAATNSRQGDSGPVAVIADSTLAALRGIEVAGEPIPTLEELLATVPEHAVVYVEVKAARIEDAVISAIRSGGRRCAVHSFDHRVARRVHALAPDLAVGVLQTSYPVDPVRPLRDAGARDLWQQWELIDAELIQRIHDEGGRVIAWTVNDPTVAQRLSAWGIDGICTDVPGAMRHAASSWPPR
jgi:glycerophosphoryl diester phosphodiesterase